MIEKIKENPKKFLGIVAGVFFVAAILFMLLPGLTVSINKELEPGFAVEGSMIGSLFAFAFGGKYSTTYKVGGKIDTALEPIKPNTVTLIAVIFIILAIVGLIALICGLFTNKFNKKITIITAAVVIVLVVAASIMIFTSKNSMLRCAISGEETLTDDGFKEALEYLNSLDAKISLGAGAIVAPIMALLGALSLGGVICLSAKEAK